MTENEKYLNEARALVKKFEAELESERLREAYMTLENVWLANERDTKTRTQMRKDCLILWLEMVQILDQYLDPAFDPEDVPENLVSGDTNESITEKAIAENRAKANNYRLQIHLGRIKEQIPSRAKEFIRNSYTSDVRDQDELKTAIDQIIKKPERKAELSELLTPPQP